MSELLLLRIAEGRAADFVCLGFMFQLLQHVYKMAIGANAEESNQ